MVEFYPDEETEMRVGSGESAIRLPGVYHVKEEGGGYTTDYVAQEIRARRHAETALAGGGTQDSQSPGGGGGVGPGSGGQRSIDDPQVPVQTWDERSDVSGSPPQMERASNLTVSGDQEANKLVSGNFRAAMNGDGWAIRNIGVSDPVGGNYAVAGQGNGIIEHCYFGEGGGGEGIFVHPDHSGTILIRFCYIAGFSDNGIYGSAPGNGSGHSNPGQGGTVIVENCYLTQNAIANLRLGTTGSGAKNTVTHDPASPGPRAVWAYYEDTVLENCDIGGRIVVGEDAHSKGTNASLELRNCRWDGGGVSTVGSSTVSGADAAQSASPDFSIPGRVPTTPEQAAQGTYWSQVP